MAFWKIVALACTASIISIVDAKGTHHQKRDITSNICDKLSNTNKVHCYCSSSKDNKKPLVVQSAECYLTQPNVAVDNTAWRTFKTINTVQKVTFTNTKGIPLTYVPTEALEEMTMIMQVDFKYGMINTIGSFAFANLSSLEEIALRGNQIVTLDPYAFIHHKDLKVIGLDTNNIAEINRNVFVDLPALEKLYLTNNKISIIHDRAFIHLVNLKELEIDRNKVFSLNFAVFEGLKNLESLDLSSNSLEVIGDNTFQALENLKFLNLVENKIQMLDDKAFNGLSKLQSLTLARNKLVNIESDKVFEGLESLLALSLKGNQIKELKPAVMAPILSHFYGNNSSLDIEDNNFPCDCRLDWLVFFMNKTSNKHLKIVIENFKCTPDANLRELWAKTEEVEKSTQQTLEDEGPQAKGEEYEYYDDTQLNGKMFYTDVRELLNCSRIALAKTENHDNTTTLPKDNANLSISTVDTTTTANEIVRSDKSKRENNEAGKHGHLTTTRLATVSAKPVETKMYEDMASDDANSDKNKAHRSIQEERKESAEIETHSRTTTTNNANTNLGCVTLLVLAVLCSTFHF